MLAWLDDEEVDEDEELEKKFRPISNNETTAVLKNRVEYIRLIRKIKVYRVENKYNCLNIKNFKNETEKSESVIKLSTGYAFNRKKSPISG